MKVVRTIGSLKKALQARRRLRQTIGFVPTMGYLHEGHLSLVKRARRENGAAVVSIFVNPLQFGPREDFKEYPRDIARDLRLLKGSCDIVFIPPAAAFYPHDFCSFVEVKGWGDSLCGLSRPGHFTGVTTVLTKLFHMIGPDAAYFGQKDAQQAAIVRKMVADLDFPLRVVVCPIVREKDGLAMSSRNVYLSETEREEAAVLYQALKSAEHMAGGGMRDAHRIKHVMEDFIKRAPHARIDYIDIVDKESFDPVRTIEDSALLLLAVYMGKTRLIDNTILRIRK